MFTKYGHFDILTYDLWPYKLTHTQTHTLLNHCISSCGVHVFGKKNILETLIEIPQHHLEITRTFKYSQLLIQANGHDKSREALI